MPNTITYTVTTVAGSRQHTVEGVKDNFAATDQLMETYSGKQPGFFLPNPPTYYTLSNVISVSFEGSAQVAIDKVERSLGFSAEDDDQD